MTEKNRYRVLSNIHADGKEYKKGEVVALDPDQAKAIPWAVEPLKGPPEETTAKK